MSNDPSTKGKRLKLWFKRIGIAGFLFFLAKGLVWIAVFYFGLRFSGCES